MRAFESIAYPEDLDGMFKERCEAIMEEERNMVAKANGWK